jgi:hypothetical protein
VDGFAEGEPVNVFEILLEGGKLEASVPLDAIDSIQRTTDGAGTEIWLRSGRNMVLKRIPIEVVAKALRDAP